MRAPFNWTLAPDFLTAVDKRAHLAVSMALTLTLAVWHVPILGACGVALALGLAKEIGWDWWLGRGSPELGDAVANVVGILTAFVVVSAA